MLGRMQRAEELGHRLEAGELFGLGEVPDRLGLEARLGQVEVDCLERRLVANRLLLVRDHSLGHGDAAERELEAAPALQPKRLLDRRVCLFLRLRVVVAAVRRHDRCARLQVELANQVALAEVEVHGAVVDGRIRTLPLDETEHRARLRFDHGKGVRRCSGPTVSLEAKGERL